MPGNREMENRFWGDVVDKAFFLFYMGLLFFILLGIPLFFLVAHHVILLVLILGGILATLGVLLAGAIIWRWLERRLK